MQMRMLRTHKNIEDLQLQLLDRKHQVHILQQQGMQQTQQQTGHVSPSQFAQGGRIFLPDGSVNSAAYCTNKCMDVQEIVAQRGPPSAFITITTKIWREDIRRLGMDKSNQSAFMA